jgi:hypothetical protein
MESRKQKPESFQHLSMVSVWDVMAQFRDVVSQLGDVVAQF